MPANSCALVCPSPRARQSDSKVCSPSKTTALSNGPSACRSAWPRSRSSTCEMAGPPATRWASGKALFSLRANEYAGIIWPGKQTERPIMFTPERRKRGTKSRAR